MIPQSYTLSAYSYLLLYRLREGLCNKKARFQESRFFEYSIAHLTLIAARKRHNARDVLSAILIHFLVYQMNASAYFNRRSPRGERLTKEQFEGFLWGFQSMLPVGGSNGSCREIVPTYHYFNPRSPRGERHVLRIMKKIYDISIHAPRGGSDRLLTIVQKQALISIHAPRGGSDSPSSSVAAKPTDFNPRSPWWERQLYTG